MISDMFSYTNTTFLLILMIISWLSFRYSDFNGHTQKDMVLQIIGIVSFLLSIFFLIGPMISVISERNVILLWIITMFWVFVIGLVFRLMILHFRRNFCEHLSTKANGSKKQQKFYEKHCKLDD